MNPIPSPWLRIRLSHPYFSPFSSLQKKNEVAKSIRTCATPYFQHPLLAAMLVVFRWNPLVQNKPTNWFGQVILHSQQSVLLVKDYSTTRTDLVPSYFIQILLSKAVRLCRTIPQLVYPTSARFQVCREKEVAVRLDLCLQFQHPLLAAMLVSDEPNPLPCPEIIILLQPVFEFAEKKWGCKSIQTCAAPLFPTSSTSRHACCVQMKSPCSG